MTLKEINEDHSTHTETECLRAVRKGKSGATASGAVAAGHALADAVKRARNNQRRSTMHKCALHDHALRGKQTGNAEAVATTKTAQDLLAKSPLKP
jgi:hypothetical protein